MRLVPGGIPRVGVRAVPFLLLLVVLPCGIAASMDHPHHPLLAVDGNGRAFGGYQVRGGGDGYYDLFLADAMGTHRIGRFNGVLAGVALPDDGQPVALTRDGALDAYGDAPAMLARPGSRWTMSALVWWRGAPLALAHDGEDLHIVRPDGANWIADGPPLARSGGVSDAVFLPLDDALHLFWQYRRDDLSGGVIRHHRLSGGRWTELPSLPSGDAASFTAFAWRGAPCIIARIPDPLGMPSPDGEEELLWRAYVDGAWIDNKSAFPAGALARADGFAIATNRDGGFLLTTGERGAVWHGSVFPPTMRHGLAAETVLAPPAGSEPDSPWVRLATIGGIALLALLYCRRSRALSRLLPGRPPDLISRGAALTVDWLLVSIGMGAYHVASGDVYILGDLLAMGDIMHLFWINLAALALFMAVTETAYGFTPGKYLAGLRVRNAAGGRPRPGQLISRNLWRAVDMFPVPIAFPGVVGVVTAYLNARRQRVGDILAATVVRRHMPYRERQFLLASASPRRRELVEALGLKVRINAPNIDEGGVRDEPPDGMVALLSQLKARAGQPDVARREVVIAADTVVALDGEILGKPRDEEEAAAMLRRLSGRSHSAFTGVTVWDTATGQALTDVEETEVEFRNLSEREIADYVATGDPLDKAGAYGVQTGFLVKQIRGSLSNVAGLPMEKLQSMLDALD